MNSWSSWIDNIHAISGLSQGLAGLICVIASTICGAIIGLERTSRDKPAGVRTVILICLGSTIFTLVSLLLASRSATADPARLAAQIIPGIGFLGAGAIIRSRGTIVGLTTGATIWAVAAVGVTLGAGYIAAGLVCTALILLVLTTAKRMEWLISGRCTYGDAVVIYRSDNGKTWPRLQTILDNYRVPVDKVIHDRRDENTRSFRASLCVAHREHRSVLSEIAGIPEVLEISGDSA